MGPNTDADTRTPIAPASCARKVSAADQRFNFALDAPAPRPAHPGIRGALTSPARAAIGSGQTSLRTPAPLNPETQGSLNRRSTMRNVLFTITLAAVGLLQIAFVAVEVLGF
jgi:hypothetical protein